MSVARAVLNQLQVPYLEKTIAQEIVTVSEVFNYLQLKQVNSIQHTYNRELTLGTLNTQLPVLPNATWTESGPTFTTVSDSLKLFGVSAYIPAMAYNDPNQYGSIVGMKSKLIGRSIDSHIVSGSGTDPQWSGLYGSVTASATQQFAVATNGSGSLTLAKVDQLLSTVKGGPVSFILCTTTDKNRLINLIRGSNTQPNFITSVNLGSGPVLTYNGVPVLVSDYISETDISMTLTNTSRMYAVRSDSMDGATLWFNNAADLLKIREVPVNQSDLTEAQVTAKIGFSVMSSLSVACIYGING